MKRRLLTLSWIGSDDLPCGYLTPGPSPALLVPAGQWWNAAAWGWWVSSQSEARAEYCWPIRAVCSWGKQSGAQCRDFLKAEQFTEVWVVAGLTKEKPVLLVLTNQRTGIYCNLSRPCCRLSRAASLRQLPDQNGSRLVNTGTEKNSSNTQLLAQIELK